MNFFIEKLNYSAYVLACFLTLDSAHWWPSSENCHFKWFFSSRVQVKTTAFSRNPRTIRSTQNLRQTQHPWTYRYSINLEKYIQMWVVNCCSSFNVVGFKSRFFPFCAPDVVDLYIYISFSAVFGLFRGLCRSVH